MNPHTKRLCQLHTYADILISRNENGIGNGAILRKCHQVCNNQRIHAFLLPLAVQRAQSQLDIVMISQIILFRRRSAQSSIIPVDAQQLARNFFGGKGFQ